MQLTDGLVFKLNRQGDKQILKLNGHRRFNSFSAPSCDRFWSPWRMKNFISDYNFQKI